MDIKLNKMKTLSILPLLLGCLFVVAACEDAQTEMPRLFRPAFVTSSCFAEDNTITLAWRTSAEATSYTVELSTDETFQSADLEEQTVEKSRCTFSNLRYETKYYARVRANNPSLGICSNWTQLESPVSTLTRVIPKILYAIEPEQIQETSAGIRWLVSAKNPVDGLVVWQEGTAEEREIALDDASTGTYTITGLAPRTTYCIALTNSAAPEGAERYNQRRFTTAGMPEGAVLVEDGVDLMNKLKSGMADESKQALVFQLKNGVDYYLTEGGAVAAKTGEIELTKSLALLANPGEHPTLYIREGCFIVKPTAGNVPSIAYFTIENVDIKETLTASKPSKGSKTRLLHIGKHDAGTDLVIDRFEIRNSEIVLPSTVLMMSEASEGLTTINHIRIDNCLVSGINDTKNVTKQFGFIHAIDKGSDVWNDVLVSNSTFYEFYISPGLFGSPQAGVPLAGGYRVQVANCTFCNWGSNEDTSKASYRAIGDFARLTVPLNLSISNCLFGSSRGKVLEPGSANLEAKGNYCTADFKKMSDAGLTLIGLEAEDASLFRDAASGDFSVIDAGSIVYKSEIGDPRWIGVLEVNR